ncbi:MAG: phosphoglucosamine mutase, partial [Allobranchiibius sp.]
DGLHIVLDAANGAAFDVAPRAFEQAGARITLIGATPDGININEDCGSTHLGPLRAAVLAAGADLGLAFDGDADRCLAVDGSGHDVDGDQIMAVLAIDLKRRGRLAKNTLVATVMSNLGLHHAMRDAGIEVRQTGVGDRYVLEEMRARGFSLGGEQSGHVILLEHGTTGDGVLTGLLLAACVASAKLPLATLAGCVTRLPQILVNVPDVDKHAADHHAGVQAAVRDVESELGDTGRVLLRKSGTEALVRVMVEATTPQQAKDLAARLADVVARELSLN